MESLLLYAPIGFAFYDREHRFLRLNKALAEINGVSETDSLGKPLAEVLPIIAGTIEPILDQVMATGHAVEAEITGETPKERRNPLLAGGLFSGICGFVRTAAVGAYVVEITERKRAEVAGGLPS